jgi:hypothetical protein
MRPSPLLTSFFLLTGGILRLDGETEVTLETVLARSLSSSQKLTNLVLLRGHIHLNHRRHSRSEVFQVLTPNSAVKLDDRTVATVGLAPGRGLGDSSRAGTSRDPLRAGA